MTRRLTLAIVATTLLTLVITGVGMILLTRYEDLRQTEDDLRDSAEVLAAVFEEVPFVEP